MKKILLSLILSTGIFADVIIVGNTGCKINTISSVELKNLYLGLNKSLNNEKVVICDRDDVKLYEEFVTDKLKKSAVSLETYWVRMLFSGRAKPPQQISYSKWLEIKDANECTITYVKESEYKNSFKRIAVVE